MSVLWVIIDNYSLGIYNVSKRKRDQHLNRYHVWSGDIHTFPPKPFERLTGIKLNPGEGPVKIEIRRVK